MKRNYTYPGAFVFLLMFFTLLPGCKSGEKSAGEWSALANAAMEKIKALTSAIPCDQADVVEYRQIPMGCGRMYFPVTPAFEAEFTRLAEDYQYYSDKALSKQVEDGLVVEPCPDWIGGPGKPLDLVCAQGYLKMLTSENLPLEEAQSYIEDLYARITHYQDTLGCQAETELGLTMLMDKQSRDLKYSYFIFSRLDRDSDIYDAINHYNRLRIRQIEASADPEYLPDPRKVDHLDCVDGKPVIVFKGTDGPDT